MHMRVLSMIAALSMITVLSMIPPLLGVEQLEERTVLDAIPTPPIFQNPFMAPNDFSEIHLNAYQTDTTSTSGPASARSQTVQQGLLRPITAIEGTPPNIVLVIMDDIGIDQWKLFGYGGGTPASTPNIDTLAAGGIQFHSMWSMPACSNGRAALFTGRYPFRTNVLTALGNNDLANYMVNPNEITLPRLLKQRGYKSALFGKFHLYKARIALSD